MGKSPSFKSRHRGSRKISSCRLIKKFPFFQSASLARKIHQKNVRERWRGYEKMRKMGLEKMGNFVPNCPIFLQFFSHFQPISHSFSTFPGMYFWQFLTLPHSRPFPPISPDPPPPISPIFPHVAAIFPFSPFFQAPAASQPIRLRLHGPL